MSILDWIHANAIEEDSDGDLLVSLRHFDQIIRVDRSGGDSVLWRLGGATENWFAYVLALLVLTFRPQGLFGEKIIERV